MKNLLIITMALSLVLVATTAMAERGYGGSGYYASQGERIDRHLDRQGDRIQHRFEHKAERAEDRGNYAKADRMRAKGERINRHLDRKGDRIQARFDRRHDHKHYKAHRHDREHRHYYPRPRVGYRDYAPYDTYFGVVINQPGLWLGWGWYD